MVGLSSLPNKVALQNAIGVDDMFETLGTNFWVLLGTGRDSNVNRDKK
jgi:hypothetical protein